MAFSFVQAKGNGSGQFAGVTSLGVTWDAPTVAGNSLFACIVTSVNTVILPPAGWTQEGATVAGTGCFVSLFFAQNAGSRSTDTWGFGTATIAAIEQAEFSGGSTSALDEGDNVSSTGNGNSVASGSLSDSNATDLLLCAVGTSSLSGGFPDIGSFSGFPGGPTYVHGGGGSQFPPLVAALGWRILTGSGGPYSTTLSIAIMPTANYATMLAAFGAGGAVAPSTITVKHFRFYDEGTETAAAALAAQDTEASLTLCADTPFLLRLVLEDGGANTTGLQYGLMVSHNGAAPVAVTDTSLFSIGFVSGNLTDGANTTEQLTLDGGDTYSTTAGVTNNTAAATAAISLAVAHETELLFALEALADDLADGDTLDFTLSLLAGSATVYQFGAPVRLLIGESVVTVPPTVTMTELLKWSPDNDTIYQFVSVAFPNGYLPQVALEPVIGQMNSQIWFLKPRGFYTAQVTSGTLQVFDTSGGELALGATCPVVDMLRWGRGYGGAPGTIHGVAAPDTGAIPADSPDAQTI